MGLPVRRRLAGGVRLGSLIKSFSFLDAPGSMRFRQVSRPSTSSVSNSGGAVLRPHTATRIGWNIWPALMPSSSAAARRAASRPSWVNSAAARTSRALLEHPPGHRGVALLGDQLGGVVGRQFVGEEEIGRGQHIAQQLDALLDQRRDRQHLRRICVEPGGAPNGSSCSASSSTGSARMCSAFSHTAFGSNGIFFREVDHRVAAVDALERKRVDQFLARHQFAVVLGRPAQQAQEVDERLRQEPGVAIGGDAHHRPVLALGELGAVGRDQQRQVREMRRRRRPAASKISTCLKVLERWSWPRMMWLMRRSASSAQEAR